MNSVRLFWKYLVTYANWILWILGLQLLMLFIAFLDYDISMHSVIYMIILNVGLTIFFVFFVYIKESQFYYHLMENREIEEIKHREWIDNPLQKEVVDYLYRQITSQKAYVTRQQERIMFHEQSVTDFVHDIKMPVTALKLLIDQEEDDTRKKALLYEWSRINDMLDKQLYLTRLESRQHDLYFEHISLKRMIIDEIQVTRHMSQVKGIGFDLDITDVTVYTDRKWCRMMIRQLLSNAVKYSAQSDIEIIVDTVDQHTRLTIRDHGIGISSKDLKRVFERGFTSTQNRDGTESSGIGLYLVDVVKQDLSITVKISSVVGEGTECQLVFPNQNEVITRMSE